jgi:hypothetical protein
MLRYWYNSKIPDFLFALEYNKEINLWAYRKDKKLHLMKFNNNIDKNVMIKNCETNEFVIFDIKLVNTFHTYLV